GAWTSNSEQVGQLVPVSVRNVIVFIFVSVVNTRHNCGLFHEKGVKSAKAGDGVTKEATRRKAGSPSARRNRHGATVRLKSFRKQAQQQRLQSEAACLTPSLNIRLSGAISTGLESGIIGIRMGDFQVPALPALGFGVDFALWATTALR